MYQAQLYTHYIYYRYRFMRLVLLLSHFTDGDEQPGFKARLPDSGVCVLEHSVNTQLCVLFLLLS